MLLRLVFLLTIALYGLDPGYRSYYTTPRFRSASRRNGKGKTSPRRAKMFPTGGHIGLQSHLRSHPNYHCLNLRKVQISPPKPFLPTLLLLSRVCVKNLVIGPGSCSAIIIPTELGEELPPNNSFIVVVTGSQWYQHLKLFAEETDEK